ncbi:MAG: sporulation transcription factor Spo0A [Bacilli bacterium]|nr:sporulation transcription factor Spo0A [Bacilli bacterium]
MKNSINILVVDDNPSVVSSIKKYFSSHAVINVVNTIDNGKEALEHITSKEINYDLIIMDILMPEVDGIEILSEMKNHNINSKVIVLTSYKKDYTVKLTNNYGVSYYMLKPFSLASLEKRILEICNEDSLVTDESNNVVEIAISKLLHSLGIPSHIKGYQYIRESIYLMYQNPNLISGITKEIYPEIAMKFDTTASRVERAIRHAIEVSWNRGDYELMEEIFGHSVDYDRAKPTNSEFIATLADKLRIDKNYIKVNA